MGESGVDDEGCGCSGHSLVQRHTAGVAGVGVEIQSAHKNIQEEVEIVARSLQTTALLNYLFGQCCLTCAMDGGVPMAIVVVETEAVVAFVP